MSSSPQNNIVRSIAPKTIFSNIQIGNGLDDTISFNQGDLLVLDNGLVKVPTSETDGDAFLGVAPVSVSDGQLVGPYQGLATTSQEKTLVPGPVYGVVCSLYLKVGDALDKGDDVYLYPAGGEQFVQAAGTKAIGTYQGPAITGVSGTRVEVLLGARYPNDTLKF